MDKTTTAGTVVAIGAALIGAGSDLVPIDIRALVPLWARQAGALMFIVGTVLAHRFALDASAVRQIALKPEERKPEPQPTVEK
jgi:hypothetical protein